MYQQRKEKDELTQWAGDKLDGPQAQFTNFPDWNNPEDDEDAPDGYYDDEEDDDEDEDDDSYVPDESDADFDLSEAAGYAGYDSNQRATPFPQWVITTVAVVLILAFVLGIVAALR
ncbi:MAG: hypothetical protein ABI559_13265 [Chloroflexota bacterium]